MDFLEDPFSETEITKAPVAGRFQPKAKPRPKKVPAPAVKATKEPSVTLVPKDSGLNKAVQPEIVVEKKSDSPNKTSFIETEFLENSLEDGNNLAVKEKEAAGSVAIEHSEIVASGPSITKVATAETPNPDASSIQSEEKQPIFSNVSFASASSLRPCKSQIAPDQSVDKLLQDSECYEEPIASGDGDFHIDVEQLGAGDFSCLDNMDIMSEGAIASEKKAVKLLPKPKVQGGRLRDSVDAETYLSHALENQQTTINGLIHGGEPDTASDAFRTSLDDSFSLDPSYYQSDALVTDNTESLMPEDLPEQIQENHGERGSYNELDSFNESVDEGFLSRPEGIDQGLKEFEFDGINDEFLDNHGTYDKVLNELASKGAENNAGSHLGEETSKKKKPRKSKKEASEKDKPTRKRKTAAQKADESIKKPPKKFPRGTRRKRCVDRSLLEAPEDELDLQRVPIKDLIVLAEYKERQAKKEAAALPPPPTSERIDNNMSEDLPYNDNETDQYGDAYDNPSTPVVQADTGYFNYQTFMTKETRARWTKQDTELFYQGISQFGSDLSMIQQLFPGRTRHQIKLKYKKEERQNPMRLHDSLTGRAKDLSHFELVIGRLEEQAARDAKTEDDSVCPTGEDERPEEEAPSNNEDIAESKEKEEGKTADQKPDNRPPHVESPPKSYLSEEDDFDWTEYKSEL